MTVQPKDELHMPFFDHLTELRSRLFKCLIAITVAFGGAYVFAKPIFRALMQPYNDAYRNVIGAEPRLINTGLVEPFMVYLKVGLVAGIFLASPYIFYQVWHFITPGLKPAERKHGIRFVVLATFMFIGGALFGYFGIFPVGFTYFLRVTQGEAIEPMIRMQDYFQISSWMMIVFGLAFEVPLVVIYLVLLRILSAQQLRRSWRGIVVGIFVGSALLTPADPGSMLLMAGPMMVLYGITLAIARFIERGRQKNTLPVVES